MRILDWLRNWWHGYSWQDIDSLCEKMAKRHEPGSVIKLTRGEYNAMRKVHFIQRESRADFDVAAEAAVMASKQAGEGAARLMEACERIKDLEAENRSIKAALTQCRSNVKRLKGKQ